MMKVQVQKRRKGMKVMAAVEWRRKINQLKRRQRPWRSPRKSRGSDGRGDYQSHRGPI
jgi:hypothetical protein